MSLRSLCLAGLLLVGGMARADVPPGPPPVAKDDGFEKVDGSMMAGESLPASRMVAIAYGVILAALSGYAFSVAQRTRRVEDELDQLRRHVERGAGSK